MNSNEKYLPIGTVVRLVNGKKDIMITGFAVASKTDNKLYDYCACLYPEGVVSSEMNLLFNHEQIEKVLFSGFVNSEEIEFKKKLKDILNKKQVNGALPAMENGNNNMAQYNSNASQPQMFNNNTF